MKNLKVCFIKHGLETNSKEIINTCDTFLCELSSACGFNISIGSTEDLAAQKISLILVGSGGSERSFQKLYPDLQGPFYLLTIPAYNSLAASFEIKGFLEGRGEKVEIINGSVKSIADRLMVIKRATDALYALKNKRLGAIGDPLSLIASKADKNVLKNVTGMELISIDLDELVAEYHKGGYIENEYIISLRKRSFDKNELEKALCVYGALKRLVAKYQLDGLTVRCFDLLTLIETTGCLGLSILNAEGIPAACEGDTKTLISMMILHEISGKSVFMANPSAMNFDTGEMILAHCTIPLDMVDDYSLMTHFESGIGVAISADIKKDEVTIFKCDETMKKFFIETADHLESLHRTDLCRTQMRLKPKHGPEYLKDNCVCNHQCVVRGNWEKELVEFFRIIGGCM